MLEGGKPIIYDGQVLGRLAFLVSNLFEDAEIAQHAIDTFLKQNS